MSPTTAALILLFENDRISTIFIDDIFISTLDYDQVFWDTLRKVQKNTPFFQDGRKYSFGFTVVVCKNKLKLSFKVSGSIQCIYLKMQLDLYGGMKRSKLCFDFLKIFRDGFDIDGCWTKVKKFRLEAQVTVLQNPLISQLSQFILEKSNIVYISLLQDILYSIIY